MLTILRSAEKFGYAQGAFNVTCYPQLKGILDTHEFMRSPAIIQVGNLAMGYLGGAEDMNNSTLKEKRRGAENLLGMLKNMKDDYSIPVTLHADHTKDMDVIRMLVDIGFPSVMIDASHLAYDDNVDLSREVVKYAHKSGVTVEAELGVLAGTEDDVFSKNSTYTNPMLVADFLRKTEADCLALSYGTKHGMKKGTAVKLRSEIVTASRENLMHENIKAMLVSHGSSTVPKYIVDDINKVGGDMNGAGGIPIPELKKVIQSGIRKINIDTDLRLSITRNIREYLSGEGERNRQCAMIKEALDGDTSEIDFRMYMKSLSAELVDKSRYTDIDKSILDCFDRGVKEMVAQLLTNFGSVGYSNRVDDVDLEAMAASYKG